MPNWSESMQQTFEFYTVDPDSWFDVRKLDTIESCSIVRDTSETLGSASITCSEELGECYIRVYMIVVQNGSKTKLPLGTFIIQTPSTSFDGMKRSIRADAYTPLLELKEKLPPIGYTVPKGTNIISIASRLIRENMRAPLVSSDNLVVEERLSTLYQDFTANTNDTWLSYISSLLANANCYMQLDELGRVLIAPNQASESLQPIYSYEDNEVSILYPNVSYDNDLFGIPNVVEVLYSGENMYKFSRIVNDDPNSPTSTVRRGREIMFRDTKPSILGIPNEEDIDEYAKRLLREKSSIECTIDYSHGFTLPKVGDCIRLNYGRADIRNIKVKITRQEIKCEPGCQVTESGVYTNNLWR